MKRLIYILLLACTPIFGQYAGTYNDNGETKLTSINGKICTIQSDNIPTSPENPTPDPEWEDSVDFETLYYIDFETFPTTNTYTATSPVGIPNDTIVKYWPNYESLVADEANDPNKADNVDIISHNGVKVLRSYYPEGQCCTGAASDSIPIAEEQEGWEGVEYGGTGVAVQAKITNPVTYTDTLTQHHLVYFPKSTDPMGEFKNSKGIKEPGVYISDGADEGIARIMILNYSVGTNTDPAYYTYAYWTSWDYPSGPVANTKTIEPDSVFTPGWHLVSLVIYAGTGTEGTVGTGDGWMHMYIDGKLFDDDAGGGTRSGIPFRNAESPAGWSRVNFATFMGGEGSAYISPKDQALDFGLYAIETQPDYDTTPAAGQDIYIPKYIRDRWEELIEAYE